MKEIAKKAFGRCLWVSTLWCRSQKKYQQSPFHSSKPNQYQIKHSYICHIWIFIRFCMTFYSLIDTSHLNTPDILSSTSMHLRTELNCQRYLAMLKTARKTKYQNPSVYPNLHQKVVGCIPGWDQKEQKICLQTPDIYLSAKQDNSNPLLLSS